MSTDLHARLLFAIDELASCRGHEEWFCALGDEPALRAALRAVLELHTPGLIYADEPDEPPVCVLHTVHCDDGGTVHCEDWPCSTIQVIAEQLGVPIEDMSITEKGERHG